MNAHTDPNTVDFGHLVEDLYDPANQVGAGDLAIWGGQFPAADAASPDGLLGRFLAAWDATIFRHRIWEYAYRIEWQSTGLPDAADYPFLERARLFGPGGDLGLRRDGDRFVWHFVGQKSAPVPQDQAFASRDFWSDPQYPEQAQRVFHRREAQALLWGEYWEELGRWHDDRVAAAELRYPVPGNGDSTPEDGQRLSVDYTVYTDRGQVAFVWWKELKQHG